MSIIERWKNKQRRDLFLEGLAKEVSKIGDISGYEKDLKELSGFLTAKEKYDLYEFLVNTGRADCEWRDQFKELLLTNDSDLPPLSKTREQVDEEQFQYLTNQLGMTEQKAKEIVESSKQPPSNDWETQPPPKGIPF